MASRNGHQHRNGSCRVATYSPGMVGFGHIRRNASIAQALRSSPLHPAVVMIAEAWQAGTLPMPGGVDCVTLPSVRKESEGSFTPRFVDISEVDLIALRGSVIRGAMEQFDPDVLIADHLPLGAGRELMGTLKRLRKRGRTRCVLGLRDILQDRDTVVRQWSDRSLLDTVRECYDAIWIYSDPKAFDLVREYGVLDSFSDRVRFTGYLDQRPRLELVRPWAESVLSSLPSGRLALCLVGGGHDGGALAEAFIQAQMPDDMFGVVVTGPYMAEENLMRLNRAIRGRPRMHLIDFLPEPIALVERADRVIAMGGYNTVCEILSLEKHALIVPRVKPGHEQWIRAQRMRDLGLLDMLHPDHLEPRVVSEWLARDLGPQAPSRSRVDFRGLVRIPELLAQLLGVSADAVPLSPAGEAPSVAAR